MKEIKIFKNAEFGSVRIVIFVQKRYNQIMSSKGTAEADKWLGMLVRTVKVGHA